MRNMADIDSKEFFEFKGTILEHTRNVNDKLGKIETHLATQDSYRDKAHDEIWAGVRVHEEKDATQFRLLNEQLVEIKALINGKLSYGKGFLAALALVSSLFGGGIALLGSNILGLLK